MSLKSLLVWTPWRSYRPQEEQRAEKSLVFHHPPIPGTADHQVRRLNGICMCCRSHRAADTHHPPAAGVQARPSVWESLRQDHLHKGMLSTCPQSQVPRPKLWQQKDRIWESAISGYVKKTPSSFPHSKAKPKKTAWVCLSGAADTISVIIRRLGAWPDDLQQLKVLSLRTDLYQLSLMDTGGSWEVKAEAPIMSFYGSVQLWQWNRAGSWGQLHLPELICQNTKLTYKLFWLNQCNCIQGETLTGFTTS